MKLLHSKKFIRIALWIKEYTKAINVFALVFFILTFVAALFWLLGKKAEAVAFVLSLCASSLFGLPNLAEFILPSRKPIKDMTHDELLNFVKMSDAKNDWKGISPNNWLSEVFLQEDPRLRFRAKYIDEGIQNANYCDEWANRHADSKAAGYWYDLYYDGNLIDRFILVSVDGGRANLPAPNWQTGKIHQMEYKVALINDVLGTVDEYIERSKLVVDGST